jgi:hypothetical protein
MFFKLLGNVLVAEQTLNFGMGHVSLSSFDIVNDILDDHNKFKLNRIIPLKTKRRPLYLKTQSVPRCKHFSSRL